MTASESRRRWEALVREDPGLAAAIAAASTPEEAIAIAREHGWELTVEDFTAPDGALSDDELEAAAGGTIAQTRAGVCRTLQC